VVRDEQDGGAVLRGRWFATVEMILAWPQQWGGVSVAGQVRASGMPSIEVSKGRRLRWRESRCGCAFYHAWTTITAKGPHGDGGMWARIAAAEAWWGRAAGVDARWEEAEHVDCERLQYYLK
jgi:hypothetical protein